MTTVGTRAVVSKGKVENVLKKANGISMDLRMDRCSPGKYNSSMVFNALTQILLSNDSLVQQFWQTAIVRTLANDATGIHNLVRSEIYADSHIGDVTEGCCYVARASMDHGEWSTLPTQTRFPAVQQRGAILIDVYTISSPRREAEHNVKYPSDIMDAKALYERKQRQRLQETKFDDKDVPAIGEKVAEVKEEEQVKRIGKRKKQKARKRLHKRGSYRVVRLVMQKYGTNRPEDAYDRVLGVNSDYV
ncbi:hypothetical protein Tco_1375673 [Tanacetum coccineum]